MANDQLEATLPPKPNAQQTSEALMTFYDSTAIPALRMASELYTDVATPQHRLRLVSGMHEMLDDLNEEYPSPANVSDGPRIICLGLRWEVDVLAAAMIDHALALSGQTTSYSSRTLAGGLPEKSDPNIASAHIVCLSIFQTSTPAQIRLWCRRFNRRWPQVQVVLALWNASADVLRVDPIEKYGAQAIATSVRELVLRVRSMTGAMRISATASNQAKPDQTRLRVTSLDRLNVLNENRTAEYERTMQRIADIFDTRYAQISWIDEDWVHTPASLATKAAVAKLGADPEGRFGLPRAASICSVVIDEDEPLIVNDLQRDPRFAALPAVETLGLRFYAGVPLRDENDVPLGTLCILDTESRQFDGEELQMLQGLADDLMASVTTVTAPSTPSPNTAD
jgi:hypothetical protein